MITYKDGKEEIVPLWSTAFLQEMFSLERANPELVRYKILTADPDEDTCKHFDSLVKRTEYVLPKEFKANRKRKKDE